MTSTLNTPHTANRQAVGKGWHADPFDQHELRYHDGTRWTEHVTHFGPVPCSGCNSFAS